MTRDRCRSRVLFLILVIVLQPVTCFATTDESTLPLVLLPENLNESLPPRIQSLRSSLLNSGDLAFALRLAAVTFGSANLTDTWAWDEIPESNGRLPRNLSMAAGRLATPAIFGTALVGTFVAGKAWDEPALSASSVRIAACVATASAVSGALKYAVGRDRPHQSPGDNDLVRPFSGSTSFPSGHTTVAFALASAVDLETEAGWVPWVVYPTAGLVGWSRIHDNKHWMSDVVAGALIGSWASHKVLSILGQDGEGQGVAVSLGIGSSGNPHAGLRARFR